jgi:hypothetical protein
LTKDEGESFEDQLKRVRGMVADDGSKWDLSDNDRAAIATVLEAYDNLLARAKFEEDQRRNWIRMAQHMTFKAGE